MFTWNIFIFIIFFVIILTKSSGSFLIFIHVAVCNVLQLQTQEKPIKVFANFKVGRKYAI